MFLKYNIYHYVLVIILLCCFVQLNGQNNQLNVNGSIGLGMYRIFGNFNNQKGDMVVPVILSLKLEYQIANNVAIGTQIRGNSFLKLSSKKHIHSTLFFELPPNSR